MASSRRSAAAVLAAAAVVRLAIPSPLAAQSARLEPLVLAGRVAVVRGADTAGVAGAWVILHRISVAAQGPVDSVRADRSGRFRFRVAEPESAAVYAVSSQYASIGYFGPPINADAGSTAPPLTLGVYDTSTAGPPLTVAMRHVVVARPSADGSRRVLDITDVRNDGATARVGADSTAPVWSQAVSADLSEARLGESDVPPSAVTFADGRMRVAAPFPPGSKQIAASYLLPGGAGRLRIPVDQPTERLELLVEDSSASAPGLAPGEPIELDGRAFRRFTADSVPPGRTVTLVLGGTGTLAGSRGVLVAAVALAGLLLAGGLALSLRRRVPGGATPAREPTADRDTLLAQLVALDERFDGRQSDTPPAQWADYQRKRRELKRRLERAVTRR